MGRSTRGPLSPDRRIFFGQGRGAVHSRELASRITASFGSRSGSSTADLLFPLIFSPSLLSLSPASGPLSGGTTVTLVGMNFQPGATVTFGGTSATVVSVLPTSIVVTTPAHAIGIVDVTVTNPDLQFSTLTNSYRYTALVIAVGNNAAASSPDGTVWTGRTIPAGQYLAAAWNGSVYAAVGINVAATSPDGITWTARTIPAGTYADIVWNGSLFVAVGNVSATSPDGITWSAGGGLSTALQALVWNGSLLCGVGTSTAATSADGSAWAFHPSIGVGGFNGIAWGGIFAAVANGNIAATSPDGVTWTSRITPAKNTSGKVVWTGTQFVEIGNYGNNNSSISSSTGSTWTLHPLTNRTYDRLIWTGSLLLGFVNGNSVTMVTSATGSAWIDRTLPASAVWAGAAAPI